MGVDLQGFEGSTGNDKRPREAPGDKLREGTWGYRGLSEVGTAPCCTRVERELVRSLNRVVATWSKGLKWTTLDVYGNELPMLVRERAYGLGRMDCGTRGLFRGRLVD